VASLQPDAGIAGPRLLATNFHDNRIDVFDDQFTLLPDTSMFRDPSLPAGYAPFNVAVIGGQVFVTYALQDADAHDDVAGPAHGFVDVYTSEGAFARRFATHGVLNSPWGMTIAPATFGQFAGDLLIGNFGDGRIHALNPNTGEVLGILRGTNGAPVVIDGLWGCSSATPWPVGPMRCGSAPGRTTSRTGCSASCARADHESGHSD
jgi:uncharacterized protein (TIGR03118 family)